MPRAPFSEDQLVQVWKEYTDSLEKQKKMTMFTLLNARKPSVSENTITIILDHESALAVYQNERNGLLAFLKSKLDNYYIELDYRIAKTEEKPKKAYTNKDKLRLLQEENPALLDLVKKLDLDADF